MNDMNKKRLVYRISSVVAAVILVVLTFTLLVTETAEADDSSLLLFGFTFTVLTISVFGVIIVFCLTEKRKE